MRKTADGVNNSIRQIAIEDQPLSSYPYITTFGKGKGFNSIEDCAKFYHVNAKKLSDLVEQTYEERKCKKNISSCVSKLRKITGIKDADGKLWTVERLSEESGNTKSSVRKWIKAGWDVEKILNHTIKSKKVRVYEWNGVEYRGLNQLAMAVEISQPTLQFRLNKGMTLEEAITTPVRTCHTVNKVFCMGHAFRGMNELCQHFKVSYQSIYTFQKEHPNMCLDEVVKNLIRDTPYKYYVDGNSYKTLCEIAKKYDIPEGKFYAEMKNADGKDTIEAVINRLKNEKKSKYVVSGVGYSSLKEVSASLHLPAGKIDRLMKSGLSFEEAVKKAIADKSKYIVFGDGFSSINAVATKFEMSEHVLRYHMSKGCSVEEAVSIVLTGREKRNTKIA